MLVLSRKIGEEIVIGDGIRVRVVGIQGGRIRLGIVAPSNVQVHRQELVERRSEQQPLADHYAMITND